jgi:hypothetical protein
LIYFQTKNTLKTIITKRDLNLYDSLFEGYAVIGVLTLFRRLPRYITVSSFIWSGVWQLMVIELSPMII